MSFVVVAEEGHMTKAAERLNASQPAVSAHIKTLESELGVTLFLRTSKGMVLTREGLELKERAETILKGVDGLLTTADKLKGGVRGDVFLGVNTDPRLLRLTDIYAELNRNFPDLSLNVLETMSWDAEKELLSGNVDLAFTYSKPADKRIKLRHICWIEMVIVAPNIWKERFKSVTLKELATFPWVWTSGHCPLCALQQEIFDDAGCKPKKAVVVDQESAILKLVSEGVGLSIMPTLKAIDVADTCRLAIVKKLKKKLDLFLIYLKRREHDQKISTLLDLVGRVWDSDTEYR
jgi:DNA-binding transcriptional LysR family regulator